MPRLTHTQLLDVLPKARLVSLAEQFGVQHSPRTRKEEIIASLVRSRRADLGKILRHLRRAELERICAAHGLDGGGSRKADLLRNVLAAWSIEPKEVESDTPRDTMTTKLLDAIAIRSDALREATSDKDRKRWGQYFTSAPVARFMAEQLTVERTGQTVRVLDPGSGTGILGIAVAQSLLANGAGRIELVSVEREPRALEELHEVLAKARAELGPRFNYQVEQRDVLSLADLELGATALAPFDCVISNPPYFKMPPSEVRGGSSPNIYTRFMEVSSRLLKHSGTLCFIIPRSFASGLYFRKFRKSFHARMALMRAHVFASRKDAFKDDGVLQENIIVLYRRETPGDDAVTISSSAGAGDLRDATSIQVPRSRIIDRTDKNAVMFLPESAEDLSLMAFLRGWTHRLRDYGLEISTGPVVPFRATEVLCHEPNGVPTVPLLWMQHVRLDGVEWPSPNGFRKPQHIRADASPKLLVPNQTYVLLRRFSAKEEARRLTAAVLKDNQIPGDTVGLENHLNFIHRPAGKLETDEAHGVAALLNSQLLDRYFRISNGNTQVNATEVRALPLPPLPLIKEIGAKVAKEGVERANELVEEIVGVQGSRRARNTEPLVQGLTDPIRKVRQERRGVVNHACPLSGVAGW
ncbi:MAG: Eco57I restriction-modification methylase domain-containing protein [Myxococcota bacterium]